MKISFIIFIFTTIELFYSTTYYVDYESGSDSNSGLSPSTAWKRCGSFDTLSTNTSASTIIEEGDIFYLRAGVFYRGEIVISGVDNITLVGDKWDNIDGNTRAVIDGSLELSGTWVQCPDAAGCDFQPLWADIYYFDLSQMGVTIDTVFLPVYKNDYFLWFAQEPYPRDPFFYNRIDSFTEILLPSNDPNDYFDLTSTTLRDDLHFTQSSSTFYDQSYIAIWVIPNVVTVKKITSFNPATNTVTFEEVTNAYYDDRNCFYAIINNIHYLNESAYYFDASLNRIYVLAPEGNPSSSSDKYEIAQYQTAITLLSSELVIEGFVIQKYFGDFGNWRDGIGISKYAGVDLYHVFIKNIKIQFLRSMEGYGGVNLANIQGLVVDNVHVYHCQRNSGIRVGNSQDIVVKNSHVQKIGRTGIYFQDCYNGRVWDNKITEIMDDHGNGLTLYLDNRHFIIERNVVFDSERPLTYHGDRLPHIKNNFLFRDNIFVGESHSWGSDLNYYRHYFSTFANYGHGNALHISSSGDMNVVVENNVIEGKCGESERGYPPYRELNSLYLGLCWTQDEDNLAEGSEYLEHESVGVFVSPETYNYRLNFICKSVITY